MKTILWETLYQPGLEHLTLTSSSEGTEIDSMVVGQADGRPFRLNYRLILDTAYRVRWVNLSLFPREPLMLFSDGTGHWFDSASRSLPAFTGCIDIDIMTTPFTNTLPIRRLKLRPGEAKSLRMVYVSVPDLSLRVNEQRYTCLDAHHYRYDGLASGFSAVLEVDDDGLVVEYEGLFQRLA